MATLDIALVLRAIDQVTGPLGQIRGGLDALDDTAKRMEGMKTYGQNLQSAGLQTMAAGAIIAGSLFAPIKAHADLADSMVKVESVITPVSGTVAEAMGRMRSAAFDWSAAHQDSASEFVESSYMMLSAGLDELAAVEATRTAMTVATATMGDASEAANLIAMLYNNVGDKTRESGEEIARLGDIVTATQQTFQFANFAQLNEGLKYGIPTALTYGVTLEQLSGVLGALNNAGLQGSMAGTAFNATMAKMQDASKKLGFEIHRNSEGGVDFIATMRGMEERFGSMAQLSPDLQQKFQDAFDMEGLRTISLLMGTMDGLEPSFRRIEQSAGAAAAAQSIMEGAPSAQWAITFNNVANALAVTGEVLTPIFASWGPPLRTALVAFRNFIDAHPNLVRWVGILTGVLAGLLLAFGGLMFGMGTLIVFSVTLWQGFAMLKFMGGVLLSVWKGMALGAWTLARGMAVGLFNALRTVALATWNFTAALLANPITWIVLGIIALIAVIYLLVKNWDTVSAALSSGWESIKAAFGAGIEWVRGLSLVEAGANLLSGLWEGMKSMASRPVELMRDVAQRIRNFLPSSPAKEGPLRDLNRVRIMETVAETISSRPLAQALRSAAAIASAGFILAPPPIAAQIQIPEAPALAVAAPSIPEIPALAPMAGAADVMAASLLRAPLGGGSLGRSGGATVIQLSYSPTFHVAAGTPAETRRAVEEASQIAKADVIRELEENMRAVHHRNQRKSYRREG